MTRTEALERAIEEAAAWHEAADKALSKQPPDADRAWRRAEHQEQAQALRTTLDALPPAPQPAGEVVEVAVWRGQDGQTEFPIAGSFEDDASNDTWTRLGTTLLTIQKEPAR